MAADGRAVPAVESREDGLGQREGRSGVPRRVVVVVVVGRVDGATVGGGCRFRREEEKAGGARRLGRCPAARGGTKCDGWLDPTVGPKVSRQQQKLKNC
jgi:hypothetical protein